MSDLLHDAVGKTWVQNQISNAVINGVQGPQGVPGPVGPQGIQGLTGPQGIPGDSGLASGVIIGWAGSIATIPAGYLFCNGAAVSRTTYAALFTAIGTTWGAGDGSTTFNLPNSVDKFHVGANQDVTGVPQSNVTGSLLQTGGTQTHTHIFTGTAHSHGAGTYALTSSGCGVIPPSGGCWTNAVSGTSANTTATGTNSTVQNIPPFLAYPSIIKI